MSEETNTGHCNTGNRNTGYRNTGHLNTGHCNTGDYNTGHHNTGNRNTGDWNTGNRNTGHYNTGHCNTGYFNRDTPNIIRVFEKDVSREDWDNAVKPSFLYFLTTEWISEEKMTDEEKSQYPGFSTIGGYLKEYDYKEAFKKSYYSLGSEEREIQTDQLKALPNFDAEIFKDISGIDVTEPTVKKMTVSEISKQLGFTVEVVAEKE